MLIIDRNTGTVSCDYAPEQKAELQRAMVRNVGAKALQTVRQDPLRRQARQEAEPV